MKKKKICGRDLLAAICLGLIAVICLASCEAPQESGDQLDSVVEMVSGQHQGTRGEVEETTEKVAVGTSRWKPEDITENVDLDGSSNAGSVSEGRLYFHHSATSALLVEEGTLTWLYSDDKDIFAPFDTGDYVRVGHGMIMETYPGQTYISQIALIEDGNIDSFTDEEWSRLSDAFVGGLER